MKDSGIEWIGMIPEDWKIHKVKNIANIYTGNSIKDSDKDKYQVFDNSNPYIATKQIDTITSAVNYDDGIYIPKNDNFFKIAKKDSTLMCIEGGSAGKKIAFLNQDVAFVNKLCCFEPKKINSKFMYYYLKSPAFNIEFTSHITGLIGGVSKSEIKEFKILCPSIDEQKKIVNFLSQKISEIDFVINVAKETIEDYKKYKQIVITETVIRGLNSDVEMKDSEVGWIRKIPKHWNINMLSQIFYQHKNRNKDLSITNLLSLSYGKIKRKDINSNQGLLPESFDNYNIVEKGDIVLRLTDLQNDHKSLRVGYVNEQGIITSAYITLRSRQKVETEYYYYYLYAFDIHKGFYGMGSGIRQGLNFDELKNFKIISPSIDEQKEIVEFLNAKSSEIEYMILEKEILIKNLEEYKKSLIYEYVTGKKEVE